MDIKTRAEKIKGIVYDLALLWCPEQHGVCPEADAIVDRIMSQLDEAVREAVKHINYIDMTPATKFVYQMAFYAAREKAAGIAKEFECPGWSKHSCGCSTTGKLVAERIRAMEPD